MKESEYSWWKVIIFMFTVALFIASFIQFVRSYLITDMDIQSIKEFRVLDNRFPIVSTEIAFQTKSFQTNKPNVLADIDLEIYPHSSEIFRNFSVVFTEKEYEDLNPELINQILLFHRNTSLSLNFENKSDIKKDSVALKFPYSDKFGMYIFAFAKNNQFISYLYHENVFTLESNQLDEKISLDTTRNGIRIEGLTLGGLGIALIMFLIEVGIKKDD